MHSQKRTKVGVIAQLVEQRTENPCVPGSIPGDTTEQKKASECYSEAFFVFKPAFFSVLLSYICTSKIIKKIKYYGKSKRLWV